MFMRFVLMVAVLMVVIGAASQSGFFERFAAAPAAEDPAEVAASGSPPSRAPLVLRAGENGHFFADATVSGKSVRFMVDTGASLVVLSAGTARRLGLSPSRSQFSGASQTGNGIVAYAPVRLSEIRIGSIRIANVEAAIFPEGALDTDLLGMSFLKRLRGFESSGQQMVLTP